MNNHDINAEIAAAESAVPIIQRMVDMIVADAIYPLHVDKPLTQEEYQNAQWQLMRTLPNQHMSKLVKVQIYNSKASMVQIDSTALSKLSPLTIVPMTRKGVAKDVRITTSRWNWGLMQLLAMASKTTIDDVVWNLMRQQKKEEMPRQGGLF